MNSSVLPRRVRAAGRRALQRLRQRQTDPIASPQVPPESLIVKLDTPAEGEKVSGETVAITGWALWEGRAASRIDVLLNGDPVGRARLGVERPDVEAAGLGGEASLSGYEVIVPVPPATPSDSVISAVAWFDQGQRRLEVGPRSFRFEGSNDPDASGDGRELALGKTIRTPTDASSLPAVLVMTHQLDLGGGQLYLHELLRQLRRHQRFRFVVVSMVDGALRRVLEDEGVDVHLTSPWPSDNPTMYDDRMREFLAWASVFDFKAVLANTVGAFPGIHIASRLRVPSIWAIHESYPLPVLWDAYFGYRKGHPTVRAAAAAALDLADALVFEAEATKTLYARPPRASRCRLVPYGIDMAELDAETPKDRATARKLLALPQAGRVLLCMGMFERRKSQPSIIKAFQQVAADHPDAQLILVGDDGRPYSDLVRRAARVSGLGAQIRIEKVTHDIATWYRAADILISASDVESMPRSAIESMALGRPVLAASVYGVPELIEDGVTGWLFQERDVDALATALERALAISDMDLESMGARASSHVRTRHDSAGYAAEFERMLGLAIAGQPITA